MRKLTERESLFCCYYKMLGNAWEAAVQAGFERERARESAARLLLREEIIRELERVDELMERLPSKAVCGLERLAFGSVNDAVRLLFLDEAPTESELINMDLYCVSEIRRPKGGGLEVRFHDRHKALETLLSRESRHSGRDAAASLYEALNRSAAACAGSDSDDV